jgi:hypothetical protein
MENIIGVGAIIGFVNMFGMGMDGNWKSFGKALLGVVLGVIFGYLGYFGIEGIEMGLLVGLASCGLFKLTQNIGITRIIQP